MSGLKLEALPLLCVVGSPFIRESLLARLPLKGTSITERPGVMMLHVSRKDCEEISGAYSAEGVHVGGQRTVGGGEGQLGGQIANPRDQDATVHLARQLATSIRGFESPSFALDLVQGVYGRVQTLASDSPSRGGGQVRMIALISSPMPMTEISAAGILNIFQSAFQGSEGS